MTTIIKEIVKIEKEFGIDAVQKYIDDITDGTGKLTTITCDKCGYISEIPGYLGSIVSCQKCGSKL